MVVRDVVERDVPAVDRDVRAVVLAAELRLGKVLALFARQRVIREEVEVGELAGEVAHRAAHDLTIVGKVERRRLVADVNRPYGGMILEALSGVLILPDRVVLVHVPVALVAPAAPPRRDDAAEEDANLVLRAEVKRFPVEVLDHKVYSAVGDILDVRLRAGVRLETVRPDIQLRAVHSGGGFRGGGSRNLRVSLRTEV